MCRSHKMMMILKPDMCKYQLEQKSFGQRNQLNLVNVPPVVSS